MIDAVIFDIDGTLVDSNDLHAAAWQETFRYFGKEVPLAKLRSQIGKGGDQYIPVFWGREEAAAHGKEISEYRGSLFQKKYMRQVQPFPEVLPLFKRIRRDGKSIALASSSKKSELDFYKELLDLGDLAEVWTSADDAEKSKPFPDIFSAALAKLQIGSNRQAIVVGDTPYDAEAAAKIGMQTVGLLCGGFGEKELRNAGAIAVYRNPAELLALYEKSPINE